MTNSAFQQISTPDIRKGLDGVIADETAVSKVIADKQSLTYRGYNVSHLAEQCRFEEVAYLLLFGELPTQDQLDRFDYETSKMRAIPDAVLRMIQTIPKSAHPMLGLQSIVAYAGAHDPLSKDMSMDATMQKILALYAQLPTMVAAYLRHWQGQDFIAPKTHLNFTDNFFYMCTGQEQVDDAISKCFDVSMTLYAEHGFNASTFTARVIASSLSDVYSAVSGAIGSLRGPLHGGANEAVVHMLREIGCPDRAQAWIDNALAQKAKVMGFGHRVYRKGDSRVPLMRRYTDQLANHLGKKDIQQIQAIVEKTMIERKNIYPNLDWPAGPAYDLMGFPVEFYTLFFVMSRITGWGAHLIEQLSNNKLIRPLAYYTGSAERTIKPKSER